MEEGQYSSVVTWSEEALSWLRRRNELLVQPRVPTLTRKEPSTLTGDQARYTTAVSKYTEKPKVSDLWDSVVCWCAKHWEYVVVILVEWIMRMNSFLISLPSFHLSSPPLSPLFSLPPLLSSSPAPCVQSHIMRHHSQLAVKPPQDSLHPPHTPHNPAQPKDTQALVPAGDVGRHIKRESSKSVLPAGLVAVVTRDDLIGKVHMYEYLYGQATPFILS